MWLGTNRAQRRGMADSQTPAYEKAPSCMGELRTSENRTRKSAQLPGWSNHSITLSASDGLKPDESNNRPDQDVTRESKGRILLVCSADSPAAAESVRNLERIISAAQQGK